MAFENFPEAEKQPSEVSPPPSARNTGRTVLTAVLVAALLGTWGYIIYDKNKTKETLDQKENVIATTSVQRDELQKELEDAAMRYDMLKTSNSKKDSVITAKDKEIEEKKIRIQTIITKSNATQSELAEARKLIASLNTDIEGYKQQVEVLQGEKIQLTQEKEFVTKQRDRARKDLDSAETVIKTKDDLIDVGSTLHVSNFNIVGVNEKGSSKEKPSKKGR